MRIFVAGATGAIGRPLVPRLVAAGHDVVGMARSPERAATLRVPGAEANVSAQQRRASNARARAVLGWSPRRPTWRGQLGR